MERGGKRFTPETSLDPTNSLRSHGCALVALFGLVPSASFAEFIFEIVDSVASKRLLAFLPSKLYRFGLCLFHDLPSCPVYLIAEALKALNYIE